MHFDYFGPAMLTIFMAMIGGWVDPMSFAFDVAGLAAVVFFVLVVVVPPHTYPYLPTPPHTSPYLPIPPHTSPYLSISPHISHLAEGGDVEVGWYLPAVAVEALLAGEVLLVARLREM